MSKAKRFFKSGWFISLLVLAIISISIGYSALNTTLNITGEAHFRIEADIRVTACSYNTATNGGLESYPCEYGKDSLKTGITLPALNSTVTYNLTITNFVDLDMKLDSINNLIFNNTNMEYTLSGVTVGTVIDGLSSANMQVTFKYKASVTELPANTSLGSQLQLVLVEATNTLTVNVDGGTWSGTTPQELLQGATTTINNPTKAGNIFTGWTVSGTGSSMNGTTFTMGSVDTTITANWLAYTNMFTYTGSYTIVDDGSSNWRIKFLTSGTFTPLIGMSIDAFLLSGGTGGNQGGTGTTSNSGGGGGGGKTLTVNSIALTANQAYSIVIGNGGGSRTVGQSSSGFGQTIASGTLGAAGYVGNNGGSGGGGGAQGYTGAGAGGSNGANGYTGKWSPGTGQGTNTYEFGDATLTLYAGGGGGGGGPYTTSPQGASGGAGGGANGGDRRGGVGYSALANTGGGGGGGGAKDGVAGGAGGTGGSGIVVIRNHR